MANYNGITRTNYFQTTDEAALRELISKCCCDEGKITLAKKEMEDGSSYFMFCVEGQIMGFDTGDDDYDYDAVVTELQKILPDNEAVIITEVGNEKMRYLYGAVTVVTNKKTAYRELDSIAGKIARDLLNNPEWTTQNSY